MSLIGVKDTGVIKAIGETYMLNRRDLRLTFGPSLANIDDELYEGVVQAALQLLDGDDIAYAYYDGDLYERRVVKRRKGEVLFASELLDINKLADENDELRERLRGTDFEHEIDVKYYEPTDSNLNTYLAHLLKEDAYSIISKRLYEPFSPPIDYEAKRTLLIPGERFYAVLATVKTTQEFIAYGMRRKATVRAYRLYLELEEDEHIDDKEPTIALYLHYGDEEPFRIIGDARLLKPNAVETYPAGTYIYYQYSHKIYGPKIVDIKRLGRA